MFDVFPMGDLLIGLAIIPFEEYLLTIHFDTFLKPIFLSRIVTSSTVKMFSHCGSSKTLLKSISIVYCTIIALTLLKVVANASDVKHFFYLYFIFDFKSITCVNWI